MLLSLHESYDTFLFIGNIFNKALDSFLSIFIKHFEFGTEIVEDVTIRSLALRYYELNIILSAVVIEESNVRVIVHCRDHYIILFQSVLLQA